MYQCTLRALTKEDEPFYFTAKDLPVCITGESFVLANKSFSPVMYTDTIVHVLDNTELGEGDIIREDGHAWMVCYDGDFSLMSAAGFERPIQGLKDYELLVVGKASSTKLRFKYHNYSFPLASILGRKGDMAVIAGYGELADPQDIQTSACRTYHGKTVYFGDVVNGGLVTMCRGEVGVLKGSSFASMRKGSLINGSRP